MIRQVSYNDLLFSSVNQQSMLRGTDVSIAEENSVYFILAITGATGANPVTLRDADDNVVTIITTDFNFHWAFRLDAGFRITAAAAVSVLYSNVSKGN